MTEAGTARPPDDGAEAPAGSQMPLIGHLAQDLSPASHVLSGHDSEVLSKVVVIGKSFMDAAALQSV